MKRLYWLVPLLVFGLLFAAACNGDDDDDDTPDTTATATGTGAETASATAIGTEEETATATGTATSGASATATIDDETPEGGDEFEGTTDPTTGGDQSLPIQTVTDVRVGEHEGYDRIVFEFEDAIPGYQVEYKVPPATQGGSGANVDVEGEALLTVDLRTAQAHDDAGEATIDADEIAAGLSMIEEAKQISDFEGVVEWAVGVSGEQPYRVLELDGPPRLVIDIAH
jgi:hypothetical protein